MGNMPTKHFIPVSDYSVTFYLP